MRRDQNTWRLLDIPGLAEPLAIIFNVLPFLITLLYINISGTFHGICLGPLFMSWKNINPFGNVIISISFPCLFLNLSPPLPIPIMHCSLSLNMSKQTLGVSFYYFI